jgi:hypothetical protein
MKKLFLAAALAAASLLACGPGLEAQAQTYPTSNPTYRPTAVLPGVTCSAACDVAFNVNGLNSVSFRVSGTGTGIAAVAQVSNDRTSSPVYTSTNVHPLGGASAASITSTGVYRVNTAGMTYARIHLTAVTGSVTIGGAGTPASFIGIAAPDRKATYSAVVTGLAPAASATDFLTLTGSASATVRLTEISCSGVSTAAATQSIVGVLRSTADSAGTATTPTVVAADQNSPAASAVVKGYTANPTTGTLIGNIRGGFLSTNTAASSAFASAPLTWRFGNGPGAEQEVVLRGATQQFALNAAGVSFTSGASLNCHVVWTEE